MKVLVPVLEKKEDAEVSKEFGRAPYFAVVENEKVEFFENPGASASGGAGVKAAQFAVDLGVDKVIIRKNVGPHAESALKTAGIEVEIKENLKKLNEVL
ncbi:Predicted Fe-Mo cluster-binding protein, NifX family [Balnearium lithotrophicum]|uniref:Predicted Fe-Mo cluster-binding protein, NifX family n=1 Tax=Balnearium lithotrophicum TaxID=223788 RepID=A0A521BPY8_9BACT|nr:NifB/NifX family molybdenum-iron cluster-binding protein [Balnearium lithotrophicum]SMO48620.1 Predicted Fe-Mo cluster-binding protein, NifX family [Balnearium lithotrophicum]